MAREHYLSNDPDALQATVCPFSWAHRSSEDVCNTLGSCDNRRRRKIFGGRGLTQTGMGKTIEMFHRTYKLDAILGGAEGIYYFPL